MSPLRRRMLIRLLALYPFVMIVGGLLSFAIWPRESSEDLVFVSAGPEGGGFLQRTTFRSSAEGRNCDPTLVRETLRSLRVGKPVRYENLTIAPLLSSSSERRTPFLTLAEALEKGAVAVEEQASERVPTVTVTMTTDVPVLIQSGDIITGGKQDRYFKRDVLLVEKGKSKTAPVFCVEPGRWSGERRFSRSMTSASNLSQSGVGATLREYDTGDASGQSEVWWRVQSNLKGVAARSRRTTFAGVKSSESVEAARERYYARFEGFARAHPKAVGVVLAAGDQLLGAEILGDHSRLVRKWPAILDAAVIDALQLKNEKTSIGREAFESFLAAAASSNVRQYSPIAAGEEYSVSTTKAFGTLLFNGGRLLHARLFPQQAIQLSHEPVFFDESRTQQSVQNH